MKKIQSIKSRAVRMFQKIFAIGNIFFCSFILSTNMVYAADTGTGSIDAFIDFVCAWLLKIGGVVALVGAVLFALGWQRDDAEGKSRGLMTMMTGFMIMAISASKGLFGL